jgi:hypothetical protein
MRSSSLKADPLSFVAHPPGDCNITLIATKNKGERRKQNNKADIIATSKTETWRGGILLRSVKVSIERQELKTIHKQGSTERRDFQFKDRDTQNTQTRTITRECRDIMGKVSRCGLGLNRLSGASITQ